MNVYFYADIQQIILDYFFLIITKISDDITDFAAM